MTSKCTICAAYHRPDQPHSFAHLTDAEFQRLMHTEELPTTLSMLQMNKRIKQQEQRSVEVKLEERRRKAREYQAKYRSDPIIAAKHRKACREYMRRRAAKKKLALETET